MIANLIAIIMLFFLPVENHCLYWKLPQGYEPKQLVKLSVRANYLDTTHSVDIRIKDTIEKLILDAERDGMCLTIIGGYRSFEYQQEIYDMMPDKAALPGYSEHQTGLAVDFEACPMTNGKRDDTAERLELRNDLDTLPEYQWLKDHADEYDMVQTYTEEQDKYPPEPWHWKFMVKK